MVLQYQALPDNALDGLDYDAQAINLHAATSVVSVGVGAGIRPGKLNAGGTPLKYDAGGGLVGVLRAGRIWVAGADAAHPGYLLVADSDLTFTHNTPSASQPRTDWLVAEVKDVGTSSSTRLFRVITGTAGVGAPAPAAPTGLGNGGYVLLASINVPASAGAGALGTITNLAQWTCAPGGILRIPNVAAISALPEAQAFYLEDSDRIGIVKGSGYELYQRDVSGQIGWSGSIAVPTGQLYGLGSLVGKEMSSKDLVPAGVSPGGVELIRVNSAGYYAVNVALFGGAADCFWTLDMPEGQHAGGFDSQGRAHVTKVQQLPAGYDVKVNIKNGVGDRTYSYSLLIDRIT